MESLTLDTPIEYVLINKKFYDSSNLIKDLESTFKIKFQNSIHPRHFNNRKEGPVLLKTFPASFLTQDGYDSRTLESTLGKVKNENLYW